MKKEIYVDHSSTTYVKDEVLKEMLPYFFKKYGNASATYRLGQEAKADLDLARKKIAKQFCCMPEEIYFTSGGSEANNLVIIGIARANKSKGNHIITTKIEHKAVLNTCKALEEEGFEVTYLDVDKDGLVSPKTLQESIRNNTILVSIMFANNEIGTIEPIKELAKITKEKGIYFHTDAVQVIGNIKIDVKDLNIDAMSISAHKFYGPKGIGAAYIKSKVKFLPIIYGGHQERGFRAGTENMAEIVGMSKALELANLNIEKYNRKLLELREYTINRILNEIEYVNLNGSMISRLPGNINVSIKGIEGEALLLMLDINGIAASSGSACTSMSLEPSHVLLALGLTHEVAHGSLRITFGENNTLKDSKYIVDTLKIIVKNLRKISPLDPEKM